MTITVDTSGAKVMRKFCENCGMLVSTMSMSFEKRFTIRPSGVVSKNAIGQRMTRDRRPVCRFREATMLPNAIASARPSTAAAETSHAEAYNTYIAPQSAAAVTLLRHRRGGRTA